MTVTLTHRVGPEVTIGELAPTIADAGTLYIAHRGGAALYPEETMVAYNNAYADGVRVLECDVQSLSDGTLVMMHDATVDRTTTSTGNVSSFDAAGWAALAIDANTVQGSNYGDGLPAGVFQDFLDTFNGKAILMVEDKDGSMADIVLAMRKSGVRQDQAMFFSFTLSDLAPAVRAGYPCAFSTAGSGTPADVVAAGVEWVAISSAATDEQIQGFIDAGLKVLAYTVNRRYRRDQLLALGVRGIFSDDPTYLQGSSATHTADLFERQTWVPGHLAGVNADGTSLAYRGKFFADEYWGYDVTTTGFMGCLLGYLCPVASPTDFTIDLKVTFVSASATDRFASVVIGDSDMNYDDTPSNTLNGYHLAMRKNGTVQIYRKDGGQAAVSLGSQAGTTIADGAEATFRVTVTPTTIKLERLDVATSLTVTTSTYRGAYIHLGRNGLSCKFRDVSVS